MAIQKAVTLDNGIVLASAYHRVSNINFVKELQTEKVEFFVQIFKDAEARNDGKVAVIGFNLMVKDIYPATDYTTFFDVGVLNEVNINVVKQCYEWLKTQTVGLIDYTENVTDV